MRLLIILSGMVDKKQETPLEAYTIIPKDVKLELEKDFKNFAVDISNKIKDANRPPKLVATYITELLKLNVPKFESENVDSLIQSLTVTANKKKNSDLEKNKKETKTKADELGEVKAVKKDSKFNKDDDFM